jgi:hypothetical protein
MASCRGAARRVRGAQDSSTTAAARPTRPAASLLPFLFRRTTRKNIATVGTMAETLTFRGSLKGHQGWVTAIATPIDPNSDIILSASR